MKKMVLARSERRLELVEETGQSGYYQSSRRMVRDVLVGGRNWVENSQLCLWPLAYNLFKVSAPLGLLAWLALRSDWSRALGVLRAVPWFVSGLGFLLMILAQMLGALRLQQLLAAQEIRINYLYSLRLTFAGLFTGNFLPSTVGGDAVKVLALARGGHGKGTPTASVVVDRLINLVAVASLLPAVVLVPKLFEPGVPGGIEFGRAGLVLAGGVLIGVVYVARGHALRRVEVVNSGSTLQSRAHRLVHSISVIAGRWVTKPEMLLVTLCLSWVSVLSAIVAVWVAARGLGIRIGFVELLAVVVLVYFAALLPISLNGLGIQEVSMVYLLSRLGVSPEQGLALAVLVRLLYVGTSLLGVFEVLAWQRSEVDSVSLLPKRGMDGL